MRRSPASFLIACAGLTLTAAGAARADAPSATMVVSATISQNGQNVPVVSALVAQPVQFAVQYQINNLPAGQQAFIESDVCSPSWYGNIGLTSGGTATSTTACTDIFGQPGRRIRSAAISNSGGSSQGITGIFDYSLASYYGVVPDNTPWDVPIRIVTTDSGGVAQTLASSSVHIVLNATAKPGLTISGPGSVVGAGPDGSTQGYLVTWEVTPLNNFGTGVVYMEGPATLKQFDPEGQIRGTTVGSTGIAALMSGPTPVGGYPNTDPTFAPFNINNSYSTVHDTGDLSIETSVRRLLTYNNEGSSYKVTYWFPLETTYAQINATLTWTDPAGNVITKTASSEVTFALYDARIGITNICHDDVYIEGFANRTAHVPTLNANTDCSFPQGGLQWVRAEVVFSNAGATSSTSALNPTLVYRLPPELQLVRQSALVNGNGVTEAWDASYSADPSCGPATSAWTSGYPADLSAIRCLRIARAGLTPTSHYYLYSYLTTRPDATLPLGGYKLVENGVYFAGLRINDVIAIYNNQPVSRGSGWAGVTQDSTVWNLDAPDLRLSGTDATLSVGTTTQLSFQPFYNSQTWSESYTNAAIHVVLPPELEIVSPPVLYAGTAGAPYPPPVTSDGAPVVPQCTTTQRTATSAATIDCSLPGVIPALRPGVNPFDCGPGSGEALVNCFDTSFGTRIGTQQIWNTAVFQMNVRLVSGVLGQYLTATGSIFSQLSGGAYANGTIPPVRQSAPFVSRRSWSVGGNQNLAISATPSQTTARANTPLTVTVTYQNIGSVATANTWAVLDLGRDARSGGAPLPAGCAVGRPVLLDVTHTSPLSPAPNVQYTVDAAPTQSGNWLAWDGSLSQADRAKVTALRWQPNSSYSTLAGVYGPLDPPGVEQISLLVPNEPGLDLCNAPEIQANGFAPAGPLVRTKIIDQNAPTFTNCPAQSLYECNAPGGLSTAGLTLPATATTSTGAAATITDPTLPALISFGAPTPVTYTATDAAGLTNQCFSTIAVQDTVPPTIACPGPLSLECDRSLPAYQPPLPAATDLCSAQVTVTASPSTAVPRSPVAAARPFTFTATDAQGKTSSCVEQISVVDTQQPVLSGCNTSPLSTQCNSTLGYSANAATFSALVGAPTATDVCLGPITPTRTPSANTLPFGTSTVTWSASDGVTAPATCSRSVTVFDVPPTITCPPSPVAIQCANTNGFLLNFSPGLAPATDACGTATVRQTAPAGSVTLSVGAQPTLFTYVATGPTGLQSTCSQTFALVDTTPPTVSSCPAGQTFQCSKSASPFTVPNPVGSDTCSSVVNFTRAVSVNGGTPVLAGGPGNAQVNLTQTNTTDVTFTAIDLHSNINASCKPHYVVQDTTPPVITCPSSAPIGVGGQTNVVATATDTCDAVVTPSCVQITPTPGHPGVVTCTVTDKANNTASCTSLATVPNIAISDQLGSPATAAVGDAVKFTVTFSNSAASATQHTFIYDLFGRTPDGAALPGDAYAGPITLSSAVLSAGAPADLQMIAGATLPAGAPATWSWVAYVPGTAQILGLRVKLRGAGGVAALGQFSSADSAQSLTLNFLAPATSGSALVNSAGYRSDSSSADSTAQSVVIDPCSQNHGGCFATQVCSSSGGVASCSCPAGSLLVAGVCVPPSVTANPLAPIEATGPLTPVALSGTGNVTSYSWTEGGRTIGSGLTPTAPLSVGSHTITLTGTGPGGLSATSTVVITVKDTTPPVLPALVDLAVHAVSPQGAVVNYTTPLDNSTDLVDLTDATTCAPAPGLFPLGTTVVTCESQDLHLNKSQGTFNVIVTDVAPVAHVSPVSPVAERSLVTLSGSGTDVDDAAASLSYLWTAPAGIVLTGANTQSPTFTAPEVGPAGTTLTGFTLTVTDPAGKSSTTSFDVPVTNVNRAPTCSLGPDRSVEQRSIVGLKATASDPDGDPLVYSWSGPAGLALFDAGTANVSFIAPAAPGAPVTLSLTVTDPAGATGSCSVQVTSDPLWVQSSDTPPCDPRGEAEAFATPGLLLFEDLWPALGDTDFNDQTVSYDYSFVLDGSGRVSSMQATYNVLSIGASIHNGISLHLPVPASAADSIVLTIDGQAPRTLSPMAGEPELTVQVLDDTRRLFAPTELFINTRPELATQTGKALRLVIHFADPVALDHSLAPFDFFLSSTIHPSHEIHLAQFAGTQAMDRTLFGQAQDGSTATRHFVNNKGLPYGLAIPKRIQWPQERVSISKLFPDITAYATSGGTEHLDWYQTNVHPEFGFSAGLGGSTPPAPGIVETPSASLSYCQ